MLKIYFFKSSRKSEKGLLTIATHSEQRAYALAVINFRANLYDGTPVNIKITNK